MNRTIFKKKKNITRCIFFLSLFGVIILITVFIFTLYFNNVFKKFMINQVTVTQEQSLKNIEQLESDLRNVSTQILNHYSVAMLLYFEKNNDLDNISEAISFMKSIKIVSNLQSIQIVKPSSGKIWLDTSMNPQSLETYYVHHPFYKTVLEEYSKNKTRFFIFPENNILIYVYEDNSGQLVFFNLNVSNMMSMILPDNLYISSNVWLYYNGTLFFHTDRTANDILHTSEIKHKIDTKEKDFLYKKFLYIYTQNNDFLCITQLKYSDIIADSLKTASFIWIAVIALLLFCIIFLKLTSRYFNQRINRYESQIASINYRANKDKIDGILFKVFNHVSLTTPEFSMLSQALNGKGNTSFCAVVVKIANYNQLLLKYGLDDLVLYKYGIRNLAEELFSNEGYCKSTDLTDECIALLISIHHDGDLSTAIENIKAHVADYLAEITLSFAVTKELPTFRQAISHAPTAVNLIHDTYTRESSCIIWENEITVPHQKYPYELEKSIIAAVDQQQISLLDDLLKQFLEFMKPLNRAVAEDWLLTLTINTFHKAFALKSNYIGYDDIIEITTCETAFQAMEYLKKLFITHIPNEEENYPSDATFKKMVEKLTDRNYSNPDYDLTYLSQKLYLSKVYVGRKFRIIFNKTFSQYLTEYRMNVACDLLITTNQKIADIAQLCGFSSSAYFVTLFKKYKQMTPLEFRNRFHK